MDKETLIKVGCTQAELFLWKFSPELNRKFTKACLNEIANHWPGFSISGFEELVKLKGKVWNNINNYLRSIYIQVMAQNEETQHLKKINPLKTLDKARVNETQNDANMFFLALERIFYNLVMFASYEQNIEEVVRTIKVPTYVRVRASKTPHNDSNEPLYDVTRTAGGTSSRALGIRKLHDENGNIIFEYFPILNPQSHGMYIKTQKRPKPDQEEEISEIGQEIISFIEKRKHPGAVSVIVKPEYALELYKLRTDIFTKRISSSNCSTSGFNEDERIL